MNKLCVFLKKIFFAFIFLALFIYSSGYAAPLITFNDPGLGLIKKSEIGSTNRGGLKVRARGRVAVSKLFGKIGGVLLQQTAILPQNLQGLPISLSFDKVSQFDSVFKAKIGNHAVVSDIPSWIWLNAAVFANTEETAAVTLYGKADTTDEKSYDLKYRPRYWVSYHPAIDDTLMGLMLFSADAVFVKSNPDGIRKITEGIKDNAGLFSKFPTYNEVSSIKASVVLKGMLNEGKNIGTALKKVEVELIASVIEGSLEDQSKLLKVQKELANDYWASSWSTYMLNDVDTRFEISTKDGKLIVDGVPNYRFGSTYDGEFFEAETLTFVVSNNRDILYDLNPIVFASVDQFSKMVAFFNFIKVRHPAEWDRFVGSLEPILDQIPKVDLPAAWSKI